MFPSLRRSPRIARSHRVGLNAAMISYATRDVAFLDRFASSERRMSLTLGGIGIAVDERGNRGKRRGGSTYR